MPVSLKVKIRRRSRRIALQALYEIDCANHDPQEVIDHRLAGQSLPPKAVHFVSTLVQGVLVHQTQLDLLIQANAPEWPIEQMAIVDRNILRLAVYELASSIGTPPKVAINEAVELAKTFGSDSSPRFINGVLGALMRDQSSAFKKALAPPAELARK
jgi:N utilization substance protein B